MIFSLPLSLPLKFSFLPTTKMTLDAPASSLRRRLPHVFRTSFRRSPCHGLECTKTRKRSCSPLQQNCRKIKHVSISL